MWFYPELFVGVRVYPARFKGTNEKNKNKNKSWSGKRTKQVEAKFTVTNQKTDFLAVEKNQARTKKIRD